MSKNRSTTHSNRQEVYNLRSSTSSLESSKKLRTKTRKSKKSPKIPVFCTTSFSKKDVRDPYIKTIKTQLSDLEEKKSQITNEIARLKVLEKHQQVNRWVRPKNWKYNSRKIRTTHFDERTFSDGRPTNTPRVVSVIWSHDIKTGYTRYGAVQWTQGPDKQMFDKSIQRKYASLRYESNPVLIQFNPVPKNSREMRNCLRWSIHKLGVCSTSKTHYKWKRKYLIKNSRKI